MVTFPNVSSYIRGRMGKFSHLSSDVRGGVGKAKDPPPTEIQAKEDEQPKG